MTLDHPPPKPLEDFQEVPLLRDRLFLEEQRRIQEERDSYCPTPEADVVPDDEKDLPPYWIPSVYPREPILRVIKPLLLREDVSSSQPIATNLPFPSTPATKPLLRLNSATSAFTLRSPIHQSRKSPRRLPTIIHRSAPRFETQTLQRLLIDNDFLSPTPASDLSSASRKNSTFGEVDSNLSSSSYKLQREIAPGIHPEEPDSIDNIESESLFQFEKAPRIIPLHKVLSSRFSSPLTRKKAIKSPNRRARAPQKASTIRLSKLRGLNSILKISSIPPSITAEIAHADDSYMSDSDVASDHLSESEDLGEVVENLPDVSGMDLSPSEEAETVLAGLNQVNAPVLL